MAKDELEQFRALTGRGGFRCWYELLKLDQTEINLLDKAMADPTISAKAVSVWLEQRKIRVGHQAVYRHSRRDCGCQND